MSAAGELSRSEVRRAVALDVDQMVRLHVEAFPDFFLTSLGTRFLSRLYRALVVDEAAICLVPVHRFDGFVVGLLAPQRFYRRLLLRQGVGFVMDALPAVARKPLKTARRLLAAVSFRGDPPPLQGNLALISSIAVRPDSMGSGTASALLQAFCEAVASRGARYIYLTTDRDENAVANRFYGKHGFTIESQLVRDNGRVMNRYVLDIGAGGRNRGSASAERSSDVE